MDDTGIQLHRVSLQPNHRASFSSLQRPVDEQSSGNHRRRCYDCQGSPVSERTQVCPSRPGGRTIGHFCPFASPMLEAGLGYDCSSSCIWEALGFTRGLLFFEAARPTQDVAKSQRRSEETALFGKHIQKCPIVFPDLLLRHRQCELFIWS